MLNITLLDNFSLFENERPLPGLSPKAVALLAYLICQQRPLSRESLATIFWDASHPEQAMANLRKLLSQLRKLLPRDLRIERQTVAFSPQQPVRIDTVEFQRLLAESSKGDEAERIGALETAVSLYKTDFLQSLTISDSQDFTAWAALERERFRYQLTTALHQLMQLHLQKRQYEQGLPFAHRLLKLDPLNEAAHRGLMLLLARSGHYAVAQSQYQQCAELLQAELGVAPAPETNALLQRITSAAAGGRDKLPSQMDSELIGREDERAQLHQLLDHPHTRLVTLQGPGGIGKTRLALTIAEDRRQDYLHGAAFVSVAAVKTPADFFSAVADALDLSLTGPADMAAQLNQYLQQRELLLVLDNCETLFTPSLTPIIDFITKLLQSAPALQFLTTSRERFNLQAEQTVSLTGLQLPQRAVEINQAPATRLFITRAHQANDTFALTAENAPYVLRICAQVHGSPLGIELAAAAAGIYPLAQISAELRNNLDFLQDESDRKPDRHQSLRAVFMGSWQQMSPKEQAIYAQLSWFRGSFDATAVMEITGATHLHLLSLVDKSMLRRTGSGRFAQHDLLRHFARQKLAADDVQLAAVAGLHTHYYIRLSRQRGELLNSSQVGIALRDMQMDMDNIRKAWQTALQKDDVAALNAAAPGLSRYFQMHGPFQEGLLLFGTAVMRTAVWLQQPDRTLEQIQCHRDLLLQEAVFLNEQARYDDALARLDQLQTLSADYNLPAPVGYLERGRSLIGKGAFDEADHHLHNADEQAGLLPSPDAELLRADSMRLLGLIALYRGNYEYAESCFQQALQIQQEADNLWSTCGLFNNLGVVAKNQRRWDKAQEYYQQNLRIADEIGDRRGKSKTLINLGVLLRIQGRLTAARRQYEEALQLKRTLGDYTGEALALNNLGNIAAQMGDYPAARLYFQQALQIYESLGRQRDQGMAYSNLGLLTFLEGDYPGAVTQSRQAMAIAARLGDRTTLAYAATHAAHALAAMELWEPAAEAYQQAVDLREEMGETLLMLESQAGLARIAFARGNAAAALELAAPLIPHLQKGELGSSEQPFRLYLTCIQILRHHRDGRAADLLRTAAGLLLNQAAKITAVADRRRFLQEVSAHTQLLAWADEAGIDVMVDHPAE